MADKYYSGTNSKLLEDDEEEDLSKDIALAVASILAESDLYYKERSSSEVSIDNLVEDTPLARSNSSAGEKKGGKTAGKTGKVKKMEKSRTSKSKSSVKLTSTLQPINWEETVQDKKQRQPEPVIDVDEMLDLSQTLPRLAPQPPPAIIPRNANMTDIAIYLGRVQTYINQLGYQRQGEPKIRVNTQMSVKHLLDTAKSIIKAGEQIKCLHALVLSIHFTNCTSIIERFPINFKSEFEGKEYKHVVLGIYLYGYFGALGISRDNGLQDKPPCFTRLSDMISDFHTCYTESGHVLMEVKIGGIVTHDPYSLEPIPWKTHVFNLKKLSDMELSSGIERCAKLLRSKMCSYCLKNVRPIVATADGATAKPATVFPSRSSNGNSKNLNRGPKSIKSKVNVDIQVKASASTGPRLQAKK